MNPGLPARGLRSAAELGADRPHGQRLRYMAGCRCFACRRANSDYERERIVARATGDWNGLVDAAPARAHLIRLSRAGVGRRSVRDASDASLTVINEVIMGRQTQLRARTARKILAVTPSCIADYATVPADRTWRLIAQLIDEGYSQAEIARRLGFRRPALQFSRVRVTARTAHRVAVLHRRLMT